jgi:uncharacterized protein (DUF58 family)
MYPKANSNVIRELLRSVWPRAIPLAWRSNSVEQADDERTSHHRGANGHTVAGRSTYVPGDNARFIDWSSFARTGGQELLSVRFFEPRKSAVHVLVERSPTMDFGSTGATKQTLAAQLAAWVVTSVQKARDNVEAFVYTKHHLIEHIYANRGRQIPYELLGAIASPASAQEVDLDMEMGGRPKRGKSGLKSALAMVPRAPSLVCIVSDFIGATKEDFDAIARLAKIHEVLCLVVQDLREKELPEPPATGWRLLDRFISRLGTPVSMCDVCTGKPITVWCSAKNRKRYRTNHENFTKSLLLSLTQAGCRVLVFSTEEADPLSRLVRYFARRRSEERI